MKQHSMHFATNVLQCMWFKNTAVSLGMKLSAASAVDAGTEAAANGAGVSAAAATAAGGRWPSDAEASEETLGPVVADETVSHPGAGGGAASAVLTADLNYCSLPIRTRWS